MNPIFNMVPRADFITGEVARERPILMSAPMVLAILDGKKTQTRRIIKPQPVPHDFGEGGICDAFVPPQTSPGFLAVGARVIKPGDTAYVKLPYGQPGDRLWVKETFTLDFLGPRNAIVFRADEPGARCRWKPSIFMRRAYSRITLEIIAVRVERLQDISEGDAIEEGITWGVDHDYIGAYRTLWESINGKGSWVANPYVWVLGFRRFNP